MKLYSAAAIGLILVLLLSACFGSKDAAPSPAPGAGANKGDIQQTALILLDVFKPIAFEKPIGIEHRSGDPDAVYVVEQPGRIVRASLTKPDAKPKLVLDIADRVNDKGNEQGLLGLAFHPKRPNQAYVNYTTDTDTVIARFDADPKDPERLDPASEKVLLTYKQPYTNHNGGQLAFGPDGYLYIASGDGGNGGDPQNNAQNLQSLLGKILRIDVDKEADGRAYAIPPDNPFIASGAPEIYAYGLRNPWRFSFDPATGKLWAADVGQSTLEEIDLIEKGNNYGWRVREGTACYQPKTGCETAGLTEPIHTYGRDLGISITGGYVYRGSKLPALTGRYLYSDYGTGTLWSLQLRSDGTADNRTLLETGENITSFGTDAAGELYICTQSGRIFKLAQA
ncbi:MAG: PQQ-dependent sugar dehydrogenase [Paenibacillaceae bacterium]|nr:PQQ-dependent sugar dehydrogenase [Paenibacillaceae bacterium]